MIMKPQEKSEASNQQSLIDDLPVKEDQATEVKGGPIFMKYDGIDGDVTSRG
jgi:hypothetical protein